MPRWPPGRRDAVGGLLASGAYELTTAHLECDVAGCFVDRAFDRHRVLVGDHLPNSDPLKRHLGPVEKATIFIFRLFFRK